MSRFGGPRGYENDLAYADPPQRWDRDRFERMGRGPTSPRGFEEDYRYQERDGPRRRDVAVADHIDSYGPRGRFEERDRFYEHDRLAPGGPRRRTDRELFGDVDPREYANMQLTPYRAKSSTRRDRDVDIDIDIDQRRGNTRRNLDIDIDIEQNRGGPRPGLIRRQSSLDTFDRRGPPRRGYEQQQDYRIPAYTPVPLPIRKDQRYGDDYEEVRYRDYEPEDYREVEIHRERSVHRRKPKSHKSGKSSKAKSVTTRRSSSSSSSSSFEEVEKEESIHESIHGGGSVHETIDKRFKKGKTRMPKRLVRREAVMDLGYPYDEEEDFFVLRIALEKEQIDEVMRISESYKSGEKKTVYEYKEKVEDMTALSPPPPPEPQQEREEIVRTEWINPPSVAGARSHRSTSHSHHHHRDSSSHWSGNTPRGTSPSRTERTARTSRSRRRSSPGPEFFERKTVVQENNAPPPPPAPVYYEDDRRTQIVEERTPMAPPSAHGGTLVVQEREYRSDRDINTEIAKLEAERRALRLEREADERRDMAVRLRERGEDDYQLVEYRESRPREVLEITERGERSPQRNVLRVEKDRKAERARRRDAKIVAAAMATLT